MSSSRSLIGFLLALLGARHTGSSAISTYLNVDDSGGEFLLEVPPQGVLGEPVAVYDLDNHPSEANERFSIARLEFV